MGNDPELVAEVAERCELIRLGLEDLLIGAGQDDRDLYLVFSGSLEVIIDREVRAERHKGDVVGELELIAPGIRRLATVISREPTLVGRISEADFTALAERHPKLWRALAQGLVQRLQEAPAVCLR